MAAGRSCELPARMVKYCFSWSKFVQTREKHLLKGPFKILTLSFLVNHIRNGTVSTFLMSHLKTAADRCACGMKRDSCHTCSFAVSFMPSLVCLLQMCFIPLLCLITQERHHQLSWADVLLQHAAAPLVASIHPDESAAAEWRRSITTCRIAAVSMSDSAKHNMATCSSAVISHGRTNYRKQEAAGSWGQRLLASLSCSKAILPTSRRQMHAQSKAANEAREQGGSWLPVTSQPV